MDYAKRELEYQATTNSVEVATLQRRWLAEDAAPAQPDRIAELERRLAQAELAARRAEAGMKALATAIGEDVGGRAKAIDTRLKHLESQPKLAYGGVWKAEQHYNAGIFVTHDGSLWHANIGSTGARPGSGATWTLAVKRGKDVKA